MCFLGVKNFVPHPTPDGYEPFSQLIEKANLWLKDQTDIRLTNMQSILVQKDLGMGQFSKIHSNLVANQ